MSASEINFATVGNVYDDGVSLIFDGTEAESKKHYKVNTSVSFKAGDRVKILPCSGTYVVEYVVGNPSSVGGGSGQSLPSGGLINQVLAKRSNADGDVQWANKVHGVIDLADQSTPIFFQYVPGTGFQVLRQGGSWTTLSTK